MKIATLNVEAVFWGASSLLPSMQAVEGYGGPPDVEFQFTSAMPSATIKRHSVYELRDAFLTVKTPEDALDMFRKFGAFTQFRDIENSSPMSNVSAPPILFSELCVLQEMIRKMGAASNCAAVAQIMRKRYRNERERLKAWAWALLYAPEVRIEVARDGSSVAKLETPDFFRALIATIHLNNLRGIKGALCKDATCGNLFAKIDPRREYCDVLCTNRSGQRAWRSRKAALKANEKRSRKEKSR